MLIITEGTPGLKAGLQSPLEGSRKPSRGRAGSGDLSRILMRLPVERSPGGFICGAVVGVAVHGSDVTAISDSSRKAITVSQLRALEVYGPGMSADLASAAMGIRNIDHALLIAPALRLCQ